MSLDFKKDDTPWGFEPHRYQCPVCGGTRIIHISDMAHPYATRGTVVHLTFKCFNCFSTTVHSIPVKEEYADKLKKRRGGIKTYAPWSGEYQNEDREDYFEVFDEQEQETIDKRLKNLGYF